MMATRSTTRGLSPRIKDAYWAVVEDCLVEIFGVDRASARTRCLDWRAESESLENGFPDIFYNSEQFDVAATLATDPSNPGAKHGSFYSDPGRLRLYQTILDRHGLLRPSRRRRP